MGTAKALTYGTCTAEVGGVRCTRDSVVKKYRLCSPHNQQRRTGKIEFQEPRSYAPGRPCSFEGCDRVYFSSGFCSAHYQQHYQGTPLRPIGTWVRELTSKVRNDLGEKKCSTCDRWLPEGEFTGRVASKSDGLSAYCNDCKYRGEMWRGYRITPEEINSRLRVTDGCAICHTWDSGGRRWHVDHDHSCCPGIRSCGECVRGILCGTCNSGIGMLGDDPVRVRNAVKYLEEWRQND